MRKYTAIAFLLLLLAACNNSVEQKKENVVSNDSILTKTPDTPATKDCSVLYRNAIKADSMIMRALEVDLDVANNAIRAFTDFAYYCESDSLSPIFLIKTAQIAISINNSNQAKAVLDRCINNYPKFKNKPLAIFMMAQLYDERTLLNDEAEAKKLYEKLIFEYPKSEWATNAKSAIKLLGKSDEEIIENFNKK